MRKKIKNVNFLKMIPKINEYAATNSNEKLIIELDNTKGITSEMVKKLNPCVRIRVATGYDKAKLRAYEKKYGYYYDAVIYSRNELIEIIRRMEEIEKGVNPDWSEIQKALYIDEEIKSRITYTIGKKNTVRSKSNECRTLRGLLSYENVCAGFAMIFKEMMDRQGIDCDYVEGGGVNRPHTHAWNLLKLKSGNIICLDITEESKAYRNDDLSDSDFDIYKFIITHVPGKCEKVQNYFKNVCEISSSARKRILESIEKEKSFLNRTYNMKRANGNNGILTQIGYEEIEGENLYKYVYVSEKDNKPYGFPKIIYSHNNMARIAEWYERFGEGDQIRKVLFNLINLYFSEKRIEKAVELTNGYIGSFDIINEVPNMERRISGRAISRLPVSINELEREDGTKITISEVENENSSEEIMKLHKYVIYEMIDGLLKQNIVYSEMDFSKLNYITYNKDFINQFLSRERIDRKVKENNGYLGMFVPEKINGCPNIEFVQTLENRKKREIVDLEKEDFIKTEGMNFMEL